MIAWKLTTEFDKQRHLFFEKIVTDYVVETYICSCGNIDFITKSAKQKLNYICKECENQKFYDANAAWRNIGHFLYQNLDLDVSYEYDIRSDDTTLDSLYAIQIPKSIDFSRRKVVFAKKPVCTLSLGRDGELKENYSLRFEQKILTQLKGNLTQYINKHGCFNIPRSRGKELTLKMASFFLKNKHLKEFDFYYWSDVERLRRLEDVYIKDALDLISNYPRAKSVKKAVYQNYIKQLNDSDRFDLTFVEVFSKNIQDVNILVKLLKLKLEYSIYSNINQKGLDEIIVFLKQYYSEKQLLKFFSSKEFSSHHYLFRDTVNEFLYDKDIIEDKFRKVSCKVQSIHDEFVRCSKEERYKDIQNQRLFYSKKDKKPCIELNNYQIKLPEDGKEILDWADRLHNCMAGYFEIIKHHETIIYCFFREDILAFAVEICDNSVVQASGKYNADLTEEENKVLTKWLKLFFQEDRQRLEHVA